MTSVKLGDVAEFIRGITFKPEDVVPVGDAGVVGCMRTKNVQQSLDLSDVWGVPRPLVKRDDQLLRDGDILVSSANSWNLIGKCCAVPPLPWQATFGGFVSVLRGHHAKVDSRYLYRWFSSPRIQATVRGFGQQTTNIANLNIERCAGLTIPLPALAEQHRIADILDRADAMRAKRREASRLSGNLLAAVFRDTFGDVAANDREWPEGVVLGEVAEVASGVTKGRKLIGAGAREVSYLAVSNVQDMRLNLSVVKTIEATPVEIERYRLRPGDIVLTEGGDPDKLGRGTLWRGELAECIHQNHVFRVRVTDSRIEPVFLNWLLSSERGKRYFFRAAKQTTGIASINMTQLKGFPLLLPPLSLQRRFAAEIEAVDSLLQAQASSVAELDALFASLQHRAFRGEL